MPPVHLVTGATEGIGLHTALALALLGARVLVHGRTEAKARAAAAQVAAIPGSRADPVWGDLEELAQVRALASQVEGLTVSLEVLVNNAGVFMTSRRTTRDGREVTLAVNHDAPVLLTHLLLPRLRAAAAARVVNVSSIAHARGEVRLDDLDGVKHFDPHAAYAQSKLANVLFTVELARRLGPRSTVTTSALHPGVIATKLLRAGFSIQGADVESGARTSVFCATAPELEGVTGRYYADGREQVASFRARDAGLAKAFYEESCRRVGVAPLKSD